MAFQASGGGILRRADPLLVSSTNLAGPPPSSSHLLRQWLHPFFASLSLTPHLLYVQLRHSAEARFIHQTHELPTTPHRGQRDDSSSGRARSTVVFSQATQYSRAPSRPHTPISDKSIGTSPPASSQTRTARHASRSPCRPRLAAAARLVCRPGSRASAQVHWAASTLKRCNKSYGRLVSGRFVRATYLTTRSSPGPFCRSFEAHTLDVFPARGDGDASGRCVASGGVCIPPLVSRRVRNITIVSFGRVSTCSQAWCNTRQHAPERHGNAIGQAARSVSRSALLSVATDSRWVARPLLPYEA